MKTVIVLGFILSTTIYANAFEMGGSQLGGSSDNVTSNLSTEEVIKQMNAPDGLVGEYRAINHDGIIRFVPATALKLK